MKKAFRIQKVEISPPLKQSFAQRVTNDRPWKAEYMEVLLHSSKRGTGKAVKNCEVHLFSVSCFLSIKLPTSCVISTASHHCSAEQKFPSVASIFLKGFEQVERAKRLQGEILPLGWKLPIELSGTE